MSELISTLYKRRISNVHVTAERLIRIEFIKYEIFIEKMTVTLGQLREAIQHLTEHKGTQESMTNLGMLTRSVYCMRKTNMTPGEIVLPFVV
jgi:hypothetical protein